jgi:hypothetical protein
MLSGRLTTDSSQKIYASEILERLGARPSQREGTVVVRWDAVNFCPAAASRTV